jgi:hypothetical protein
MHSISLTLQTQQNDPFWNKLFGLSELEESEAPHPRCYDVPHTSNALQHV